MNMLCSSWILNTVLNGNLYLAINFCKCIRNKCVRATTHSSFTSKAVNGKQNCSLNSFSSRKKNNKNENVCEIRRDERVNSEGRKDSMRKYSSQRDLR